MSPKTTVVTKIVCFVVATLGIVALQSNALAQSGRGPLREAVLQGKALAEEGKFEEAIPYYRRALEMGLRKLGQDNLKIAGISMRLGIALQNTGQHKEAERLFRRALEIREAHNGPDHFSLAPPLSRLGIADLLKADFPAAESKCDRAQRILERGKDQAMAFDPEQYPLLMSQALRCLGNAYRMQGRYGSAEHTYRRGLSVLGGSSRKELINKANTIFQLARLYDVQGRYVDAEQLMDRALQIRKQIHGPEHLSVGMTLIDMGNIYWHQKRFTDAKTASEQGLSILKRHLDPEDKRIGIAAAKLAQINVKLKNLPEAESLFTDAIRIFEQTGWRNHPFYVTTLSNFSTVYLLEKELAKAEELLLKALDAGNSLPPDHAVMARLYARLASFYRLQRRWEQALKYSRKGASVMHSRYSSYGPDSENIEQKYSGASEAEQRSVRPMYIGYVSALDGLKTESAAAEAFEIGQRAQATNTAEALANMAARFATGADELAKIVRERQDALTQWRALDVAIVTEAEDIRHSDSSNSVAAKQQKLQDLEQRLQSLDETIAAQFPEYSELADPKPVSVQELQKLLRPGEALVSYLVGKAITFVWVVRDNNFFQHRLRGGNQALTETITRLRAGLDPAKATRVSELPTFDAALSHELFNQIFAPIEPHLEGVEHVMVIADGPLQSLPFSVLVSVPPTGPTTGPGDYRSLSWLTKKYAFTTLPSASSLKALRRFAKSARAEKPFVGFGDPLLPGGPGATRGINLIKEPATAGNRFIRSLYELAPLPESAEELRAIANSLKAGPDALHLGRRATETAAKTMDLAQFRVVAFATHGLIAGELQGVNEPALVLTPPQKQTDQDDGLLTMSEVAQLKLDADWVILSACNTAGNDGKPGSTGLSGLARAFFYAGSRSLLVTHWPVISEAAVRLTSGSVTAATANGVKVGRSEALRRAMLGLINDLRKPYLAHPVFWAPFVVVGEGGAQG